MSESPTIHIAIKNFDKHQHYKNRNPSWIKLHVNILTDMEFMMLNSASKCLLMLLWVLASENDGVIKLSEKALGFRLRDPKFSAKQLKPLISTGFISMQADASTMQADASTILAPASECYSEERRVEREKEKEREVAFSLLKFLNEKTGKSFRAHEGTNGHQRPSANIEAIILALARGATEEQLRGVIARKCREWGESSEMSPHLNPITLFRRSNLEKYLGQREGQNLPAPQEVSDVLP